MPPCTCELPERWKGRTAEVFSAMQMTGYYDGIVGAIARCTACGTPFSISVIAWEPSRYRTRFFGVARMGEAAFGAISRWLNSSDADRPEDWWCLVGPVAPTAVLATQTVEQEILAARSLTTDKPFCDLDECVFSEAEMKPWFDYLQLPAE